jgi:hypothetical protein
VSPNQLLEAGRHMMLRPDVTTAGVWPRASAFLARRALEEGLRQWWLSQPRLAAIAECSARTQLLCAATFLDGDTGDQLTWLWSALSRACHYDVYELAPTAVELEGWIDEVAALIPRLAGIEQAA